MGHIIMETVKNKRVDYITFPIAERPCIKTVPSCNKRINNLSIKAHYIRPIAKIANSTDNNAVKINWKERPFSNWCKFNGYSSKVYISYQRIREYQRM